MIGKNVVIYENLVKNNIIKSKSFLTKNDDLIFTKTFEFHFLRSFYLK